MNDGKSVDNEIEVKRTCSKVNVGQAMEPKICWIVVHEFQGT